MPYDEAARLRKLERDFGIVPDVLIFRKWVGVTRALNEFHARDPRFSGLRSIVGTALCFLEVSQGRVAKRVDAARA
jgi:hypothetical protein